MHQRSDQTMNERESAEQFVATIIAEHSGHPAVWTMDLVTADRILDALLAAGWRAPEPTRTAIKLTATPNPDALQVRCPECDREPGQPCCELRRENLDGIRWTSFVVNFPAGSYHYAREQRVD